ncbi:MAG: hypothetical protein ABTD50_23770 [Polyangiaceae bacterium]
MSDRRGLSPQATVAIFVTQRTCEAVLSMPREDYLAHCRAKDWPSRKDKRLVYTRVSDIERFLVGADTAEQSTTAWDPDEVVRQAARGRK